MIWSGLVLTLISLGSSVLASPADLSRNSIFAHDNADDAWALHNAHVKRFEYITWTRVDIHPGANSKMPLHKRSLSTRHIPLDEDSFLMEFDAYNSTFCFHMHPNYNLLHPDAKYTRLSGIRYESYAMNGGVKPYRGYLMAVRNHSLSAEEQDDDYNCQWTAASPSNENYADNLGWARFIISDDQFETVNLRKRDLSGGLSPTFQGTFVYQDDIYSVKSVTEYSRGQRKRDAQVKPPHERAEHERTAKLVVHRRSDLLVERTSLQKRHAHDPQVCGSDHLDFNANGDAEAFVEKKMMEMGVEKSMVMQTPGVIQLKKRGEIYEGCPTSKKMLYMGVVMDCTYVALYETEDRARAKVIENWNIISEIYEEFFNINIGLLEVIGLTSCGSEPFNRACESGYTISTRLSDFSKWRGSAKDNSAGLWHLMSQCKTDPTIGIAWMNMLCQTDSFESRDGTFVSGTGVSTSQSAAAEAEWMVIAHEIGHNFGASHDCTGTLCSQCAGNFPCKTCCPCQDQCDCGGLFIMNPTNNVNPRNRYFSQCTRSNVCTQNRLLGTCLEEPGSRTALNGGICGNGVLEGEEQCDCGGSESCAKDNCCFQNCTLKAGAKCSDRNHGCCKDCKIRPAEPTFTCRPVAGECDVEEVCAGDAHCPKDTFKPNGLECGNSSETQCASGACTNRKLQCLAQGRSDIVDECKTFGGSCMMFCRSELDGCVQINKRFRDGTPCGNGGFCEGGKCSNPDLLGALLQWILDNRNIAITMFAVLGVVILAAVSKCARRIKSSDKRAELVHQAKLEQSELQRLERIMKSSRTDRRSRDHGVRTSVLGEHHSSSTNRA